MLAADKNSKVSEYYILHVIVCNEVVYESGHNHFCIVHFT